LSNKKTHIPGVAGESFDGESATVVKGVDMSWKHLEGDGVGRFGIAERTYRLPEDKVLELECDVLV
jgi:hypothetical protein